MINQDLNFIRSSKFILSLSLITLLSACGGSGSSNSVSSANDDLNNENPAPVGSDQDANQDPIRLATTDPENVSIDILSPIETEKVSGSELISSFYNTELDCDEDWHTTTFTFDRSGQASSVLCDGTTFEASYQIADGVLMISNAKLNGQDTLTNTVEYWGLLAVNGVNDQWRACYGSIEIDNENTFSGQQPLSTETIAPNPSDINYDCSEEMYWFYDTNKAESFTQNPFEI